MVVLPVDSTVLATDPVPRAMELSTLTPAPLPSTKALAFDTLALEPRTMALLAETLFLFPTTETFSAVTLLLDPRTLLSLPLFEMPVAIVALPYTVLEEPKANVISLIGANVVGSVCEEAFT